jgi:hypothetical protein
MKLEIDPVVLCTRLAELAHRQSVAVPEGWQVPPDLQPGYSDLVLDLLQVPADTLDEMAKTQNVGNLTEAEVEAIYNRDGSFCRDWLCELWFAVCTGEASVGDFVVECLKVRSWLDVDSRV